MTEEETKRGLFVVIEGMDNSGKTTQCGLLKQYFEENGLPVIQTREPGGTKPGEEIRKILLKDRQKMLYPKSQTLLFFAAREEFLKDVVAPNLLKGVSVLTDRFDASTFVYQGYTQAVSLSLIDYLGYNIVQLSGCRPDLYIILDITAQESFRRDGNVDRKGQQLIYERQGFKFRERLREGYLQYSKENGTSNVVVVDGMGDKDLIHQQIRSLVKEKLK